MLFVKTCSASFTRHCLTRKLVVQLGLLTNQKSQTTWAKIHRMESEMPPSRVDPIVKVLDSTKMKSIFTEELTVLAQLFKKRNYELRIAGGAVRDILMGKQPKDLDFATDATPAEMKNIFEEEGIRMINANGERHGTITPRINDKQNFEITTLRIDIVTDGRRAEVLFTKDWKLDANRRDLTINSMFLDLEGRIYDYFFGYDDLIKRRVVFVGNPAIRIREDYLRIFRYFRFYGRIAETPDSHEEATIQAIKENVSGLERISGERIWSEWAKILTGNYGRDLTLKMIECGIARYAGLPDNPDTVNFHRVFLNSLQTDLPLKPITLLSALLKDEDDAMQLHARLKFSAFERDLALFLVKHREDRPDGHTVKYYIRLLVHWKGKGPDGKIFVSELLKSKGLDKIAQEVENVNIPRFPINGHMLKEHVKKGKMIGAVLTELKDIWLDKNFQIKTEELMAEVPRIANDLKIDTNK